MWWQAFCTAVTKLKTHRARVSPVNRAHTRGEGNHACMPTTTCVHQNTPNTPRNHTTTSHHNSSAFHSLPFNTRINAHRRICANCLPLFTYVRRTVYHSVMGILSLFIKPSTENKINKIKIRK